MLFIIIFIYLLYNIICRYNNVISYSIKYIKQSSANISKLKFTIYSFIKSIVNSITLLLTIYFSTKSLTIW